MSTDFASTRAYQDPLFKLRVDCEREIDFDFFDDAPSAPTTPSWSRAPGAPRGPPDADGVLYSGRGDDGNVPSPRLVAGPTPADSGSSGLSSCVSLTSSLCDDSRPARGGTGTGGRRLAPAEDAERDAKDEGEERAELLAVEHADDDVVVGRAASSLQLPGSGDAVRNAPPPSPSNATPDPAKASAARSDAAAAEQNECPTAGASGPADNANQGVDDGLPDGADPPRSSVPAFGASTTRTPSRSTTSSPSSSEDSDDSDGGGEEHALQGAGEDARDQTFGIQELSLTVSRQPHRAVSSVTVSSMTAVSSVRRDSAGDSDPENAYTMEAIKKALRRTRPPSSTGSLPLPLPVMATSAAPGRPGRPRRLNMSFSNDDARRIQRENELLLRRIVSQRARQPMFGPAQLAQPPAPASHAALGRASPAPPHRCSHAVNRARRNKDIERDNQLLLKKIQTVKRSPSQLSMSRSSSSMSGRYSYC